MAERVSDIIREARERYQAGIDADKLNRARDQEDRKFYTGGDAQWDSTALTERRAEARPVETVNRLPQFVKQVTGDIRQNKPAIKVLPVDGQTDPELAKVYSAIIRHIENNHDGHMVYARETEKAVIGGCGWWRINADYYDDASFEQELCIEGIPNPNAVVCDPDAKEVTRCDMAWGFVTQMVSKKKFEKQYPKVNTADWDTGDQGDWVQGDFVRIAEYWKKEETGKSKLYSIQLPTGQMLTHTEEEIKQMLAEAGIEWGDPYEIAASLGVEIRGVRDVPVYSVSSILLCGTDTLGDWQKWPGKYIPLIRVVGEEVEAGDTVFRHGLIHHAKPPQRAYNYARNAMIERHMTSSKAPWLLTLKQIPKAFKNMWETANKKNWPFLPYDPDPQAPPPTRIAPPAIDAAAYQESVVASEDMKATTGIYDASLGAQSNEKSGVAIRAREAQGATATYVYIDNMEAAIAATGRQLIDLIPHYYSDERIIRMLGEDDEIEQFVQINKLLPNGKKWNDVTTGKYDVVVTTGPSYATKRQEAADKLIQLVQAFPPVAQVGGDIIAKVIDVPFADKLSERLAMLLPPGIDPEADKKRMEAQQQMQQEAGPQQPPPPTPEQQKMMADMQLQQAKVQADQQAVQAKLQLQREEAEAEMLLAQEKQAAELQLAREKFEFDKWLALQKVGLDQAIARHSAALETGQALHELAEGEEQNAA